MRIKTYNKRKKNQIKKQRLIIKTSPLLDKISIDFGKIKSNPFGDLEEEYIKFSKEIEETVVTI